MALRIEDLLGRVIPKRTYVNPIETASNKYAGVEFVLVRLTHKDDPERWIEGVESTCMHNHLRLTDDDQVRPRGAGDSNILTIWPVNPEDETDGIGSVRVFRKSEWYRQVIDVSWHVPECAYEEFYYGSASAQGIAWRLLRVDAKDSTEICAEGALEQSDDAKNACLRLHTVMDVKKHVTTQDSFELIGRVFRRADVEFAIAQFHKIGIACIPLCANDAGDEGSEQMEQSEARNDRQRGTKVLMIERMDRAHHAVPSLMHNDASTARPPRDLGKGHHPQNFLAKGEDWAFTFQALALQVDAKQCDETLPWPLQAHFINRKYHEQEASRRKKQAEVCEMQVRELLDEGSLDLQARVARRGLHEAGSRDLASGAEVRANTEGTPNAEGGRPRRYSKVEDAGKTMLLSEAQRRQLLTAFYCFEIQRDRESYVYTRALLRVYRFHGFYARWINAYNFTNQKRGQGKKTRAFRPGHPSGKTTSGPGLNKTINGRGYWTKPEERYVPSRRLESKVPRLCPPVSDEDSD